MPTLHAERLMKKAKEKGDGNAAAIARRLNTNRSTVARLISGETTPSIMSLLAMRREYGISLDDLVIEDAGAGAP
ncbi:helix-turn-helix transcriptional regulator [Streptomyces sp. NPDC051104]|uniref:helix-turn-helix domain-containing protein n=1 Tax=Streptomyces sp. NPDC051104 TaxID=3155044 RepID=UPI003434AB66